MNRERGFTLVEILVVMGLLAVLVSVGLFVSTDAFRGSAFHSDRDLIVSLLQHAREQAVNNICKGSSCTDGAAHGVHIDATNHIYTVFEGTSYSSTNAQNQDFSGSPTVTATGDADVVFVQLTGKVSSAKTVTLSGAGKTSDITIDTSGRISWTN